MTQPKDTDRDGLTDDHERRIGTNPYKWDTDGDGLSDGQEVKGSLPYKTRTESKLYTRYFKTNPLRARDGDGLGDRAERNRKLDPWDANTDGWNKKPRKTPGTLHQPGIIDSKDRFPVNPRKA